MEATNECILCAEPMEHNVLLPCGHSPMCMKCYLTLQQCYKQNTCPICQNEINPGPIITDKSEPLAYEEEVKTGYKFDEKLKFYYSDDNIQQEMQSFLKYQCPECGEYFTNKKQFQGHILTHGLYCCNCCSRSGRFLNIDVPIFSKPELKLHLKQHPKCLVCPYQAFDAHDLGVHMNDCHVRCSLCAKHDKILWFATKEDVFKHNRECHWICEHPDCMQLTTNAYNDQLELQFHQLGVHKTKIPSTVHPISEMKEDKERPSQILREQQQRHMDACKKLAFNANDQFHGNRKRVGNLLKNIDLLDQHRITPQEFLKSYHSICGKCSEILFCDTIAAVGDAKMRALIVRLQEGYRLGQFQDDSTLAVNVEDSPEEFPTLGSVYDVPDRPQTAKKPSKPKVVRGGKTWDKVRIGDE
ncbi:Zinc finger, C2H2 type family protein [Trichomonas vaginalis G3]|uniref:Zinc finger, C2H2 type family protein n=1 Tax=Trichomonas vaginalis (strain ATCC PRA-98 / G3) TaxID=412133 RepID=A2EHZ9_TRIV3|nr:rescue of stalled ribosome [Trichomonas vaginalis G3]EAY07731.1 Zinc finger, C2H2 type family protein [Trichomonas vaginalis G3]KAI5552574.1 rescue of stalled ribosome [Trichomonas vaginalis G3]|eukprot:XP_001319954.1 Zinc finger, C2H2 type family protein [Trichomonas vaginalis G3]